MTARARFNQAYIRRPAQTRRPRLRTIGVALGVLGFLTPTADGDIYKYIWFTIKYVVDPPPDIAQLHEIPPLWQVFFTGLTVIYFFGPLLLLFLTYQGKNWAKWLFITYCVFWRSNYFWTTYAELKAHPINLNFLTTYLEGENGENFVWLIQAMLLTASIVCLSLPPSNRRLKADIA